MSNEYNSKLIARLYESTKNEDTERILEEMGEIDDAVFIWPIFENWKNHIKNRSFISHYFLSALQSINCNEIVKIANEIFATPGIHKDIMWVYPMFTKYNYFEEKHVNFAVKTIMELSENTNKENILYFNLEDLLIYLKKATKINLVVDYLRNITTNENIDYDSRRVALYHLLRIDPTKEIQYFIDNYEKNKSDDLDNLLTKELLGWSGGKVDELLNILKIKGNGRSRELIEQKIKQKEAQQKQVAEIESSRYGNIQLVTEISSLKADINLMCITNQKIGFPIFEESERLIKQQEVVVSNESLVARCVDLREMFKGISNKVINTLSPLEATKILPGRNAQDFNKPLNRLILFLYERRIKIDINLFGLREINRLVNLFTHPEEIESLMKLIHKLKMEKLYKDKNWAELHKEILLRYTNTLKELVKFLKTYEKRVK